MMSDFSNIDIRNLVIRKIISESDNVTILSKPIDLVSPVDILNDKAFKRPEMVECEEWKKKEDKI